MQYSTNNIHEHTRAHTCMHAWPRARTKGNAQARIPSMISTHLNRYARYCIYADAKARDGEIWPDDQKTKPSLISKLAILNEQNTIQKPIQLRRSPGELPWGNAPGNRPATGTSHSHKASPAPPIPRLPIYNRSKTPTKHHNKITNDRNKS